MRLGWWARQAARATRRPKMSERDTRGQAGWSGCESGFHLYRLLAPAALEASRLGAESSFGCEVSATSQLRKISSNSSLE